MAEIAITRDLKPDSPLLRWAEREGHSVDARSFLRFVPLAYTPPAEADWWFFYSSRAVTFALRDGIHPADTVRLAAMGPGTARTVKREIGIVDFMGSGDPHAVAEAFGRIAKGQRVFFPRARQSRRTVQTLLAEEVEVLDAVCYDNIAVPATEPLAPDYFIFTSPLNVAAYLDHQPLAERTTCIAIGPSTASALIEREVPALVADAPTEEHLIRLLKHS